MTRYCDNCEKEIEVTDVYCPYCAKKQRKRKQLGNANIGYLFTDGPGDLSQGLVIVLIVAIAYVVLMLVILFCSALALVAFG